MRTSDRRSSAAFTEIIGRAGGSARLFGVAVFAVSFAPPPPIIRPTMQELHYPSGRWTGFYNYGSSSRRHPMELRLSFSGGRIGGDGIDDVGRFVITGSCDGAGECFWTKCYPGSHDVSYRGFREGKGIWGTWEIRPFSRGGFHIWPEGEHGDSETEEAAEQRGIEEMRPLVLPSRRSETEPSLPGIRACA
jgi:hypothetical protein